MDVGALRRPESGIGRYTGSLLQALAEACPEDELVAFLAGRSGPDGVSVPQRVRLRTLPVPLRLLHRSWRGLGWPPVEVATGPVDVFHTSDWSHPPQRGGATVTTVHDLGPLDHPEWYPPDIVERHRLQNQATAERAHRIIAISEYTRRRFLHHFPVPEDRVGVVPSGVSPEFTATETGREDDVVRRLGLPPRFLLYVGSAEARKNLPGLLRIFSMVAGEVEDVALALAGPTDRTSTAEIHGSSSWTVDPAGAPDLDPSVRRRIRALGPVSREDLQQLYRRAQALVFPTLYEGFGLPLLEAMSSGCPVVSSSVTAVPEVAGEAAVLTDPADESAFAEAVVRVLEDGHRREELRVAGIRRAGEYGWERTARETRDVYEAAVKVAG